MVKFLAMLLLLLQLISFNVFGEELESLHEPTPLHPSANAPLHHRHNHNLSPTTAHTPLHPSHPAKPPTRHHHQHPPAHAPLQPSSHQHPPSHAPIHHHQPRHPVKPPTHHHHQHPPAHAPVQPPTHRHHHHPPAHPPVHQQHPPAHAPAQIAVEGVVYVKSCKHAGVDTLSNATSLNGVEGAVVKLQCNNTKHNVVRKGKTDKNGYFYIKGPKDISIFAVHKCNVVLVSAPNGLKPSNINGGITGARIKHKKSFVSKAHNLILYNVKPLAFEPKCTN
ncbi:hypothetical protein MtrunA17_Chr4g0024201 [Medicago truncatula]|uniref:Pollen Ole e I family allergen n=1 Tax=Medicago truncatula TaxID=3880 RepID=A0A072UIZ1_MEDTR|nr:non-classical arabinogalactan protein 30 [Medicago truncatula]KEH29657.1 pollen Ole e I family allergen [Medicago truncatula]RHN60296.1 hypothetical protein MtrunA17_Chr4g0024201 [Medicago truncatula]